MARAPARRAAQMSGSAKRGAVLQFFRETVGELRKVVWPSRQVTTRLTMLVIVLSIFVGILLGVTDMAFSLLFGAVV